MSPILESPDRTVICSVLFADLVRHSIKSVDEQTRSKRIFNEIVEASNQYVAANERILLDTGDGVSIGYLGDPEDALYAAMTMRRKIADFPDTAMRLGLNLGPVKLVTDINGRPSLLGEGINVAERVMSFAQPGQILVSRSFRDVTVCMSAEYEQLFTHRTTHADKHMREHEVFTIAESEAAFARAGKKSRLRATSRRPAFCKRPRAIIAEDEPVLRNELKELLSAIWPDLEIVAELGDGLSAMQSIETLRPDIAFLDIEMPRMTGIDVARAVTGKVHIVMATAYDQHAISAFGAGVVDYILKPYDTARLVATCQRLKQRFEGR